MTSAQQEFDEELEKYYEEMTRRDTFLSAFRSLLHNRTALQHSEFLAKVRRFVMVD